MRTSELPKAVCWWSVLFLLLELLVLGCCRHRIKVLREFRGVGGWVCTVHGGGISSVEACFEELC